jgi:micrococcal nuclease|tara:strand:- start:506 stop:937 length:432 start_codon:yes stop_codon:yes gene_type:complete
MYNYNAICTRVVDGDTVDAMIDLGFGVHVKKRIRLAGINAPESRTRDKQEKILGLAAKDRLIAMMEGADNKFELESQELGKYGRVLGRLHIDKLDGKDLITKTCVNDCLVKEGYATEYDGGKRVKAKVEEEKQDLNEDVPFGD